MDRSDDQRESPTDASPGQEKHAHWLRKPLWWSAAMALLIVCWGGVQFVVLLIQAERLRSALEAGLNRATLPESTLASVCTKTEQEIHSVVGDAIWQDSYYLNGRLRSMPFSKLDRFDEQEFNTLRVELDVASSDLLPWWLGPRLLGFTPKRTFASWEREVP